MILETGDMWSVWGKTDLWVFTGNSYITKKNELVMGRGLALEVKKHFPDLPGQLGWVLGHYGSIYGVLGMKIYADRSRQRQMVNVFQVKQHFRDRAELALIGYSVIKLKQFIQLHDLERVDMNFPGIGCGRLPREQVLPIIRELPDVVHVWERKE